MSAGYSRMDIMSMTKERIMQVLKEEGDALPDYTVCFLVEELKRREESEETDVESPLEESEEKEIFDENGEETEESDDTEDDETEGEPLEDSEEDEDEEEEPFEIEEELTPEERQKKEEEELLELKKERKHQLITTLVGTGIAAVAVIGFLIYLIVTEQF